ncbi:MAG: GAF domain-containing protein [Synergistes sp.]|nr:GAF domain-containing protein [Synergistes sp.]
MRSGSKQSPKLFTRRSFWAAPCIAVFLVGASAFACGIGSFALFTSVVIASFVGLNEFGRWRYKANLVLCLGAAVTSAIAGVFTMTEIVSLFSLFVLLSVYIFYYKKRSDNVIVTMNAFAEMLSLSRTFDDLVENAWRGLEQMAPDFAVFLVLEDREERLYLPAYSGEKPKILKKNDGTVWRTFSSGRSQIIRKINPGVDLPLDHDAMSIVSVPMKVKNEKLGVIQIEAPAVDAFDDYDLERLSLAAYITARELCVFCDFEDTGSEEKSDKQQEDQQPEDKTPKSPEQKSDESKDKESSITERKDEKSHASD